MCKIVAWLDDTDLNYSINTFFKIWIMNSFVKLVWNHLLNGPISPNSFQFKCSPDIHNFNLRDISDYHMTCPTHTRFLWWPRWTLPLYTWSERDPTSYNVPRNKQLYIYVRGQQCVRRNMIKSNDKSDISHSYCLNSLKPSDAIWRPRSGSTLAQVMACCLTTPSHYLNQCWLTIRKV